MLKKTALIALAALGVAAEGSSAVAQNFYGSDTLFVLTNAALGSTGANIPASDMAYLGGGSTLGAVSMNAGSAGRIPPISPGHQQIAPMSRFLRGPECGSAVPGITPAQKGSGLMVALDSLGIYSSGIAGAGTSGCTTLRYSGAVGALNLTNWRDVLRLLYGGQSTPVTTPACSTAAPTVTPANLSGKPNPGPITRCGTPERRALISNWGNLFQDGGCAAGTCANGLRHAFRRDDNSGTTDVFLTLLGLPGVVAGTVADPYTASSRTFCNGNNFEDLDPVRTPCSDDEQVCQAIPFGNRTSPASNPATQGGDLGVVLSIALPTSSVAQYGAACFPGRFQYVDMPAAVAAENQRCPDGNKRKANKCRTPLSLANKFNCLASKTTVPPIATWTNMDGRVYNTIPRDPDTGALEYPVPAGTTDPRFPSAGAYRLHQTKVMANAGTGAVPCTQVDATLQLGCLVMADPCTVSFAGRQAFDWQRTGTTPMKAIKLRRPNNLSDVGADDIDAVRAVADEGNCAVYDSRFAMSRTLWMNASKGLASVTDLATGPDSDSPKKEKTFMDWISANKAQWDTNVTASDYVPVPGGFRTKECINQTTAP